MVNIISSVSSSMSHGEFLLVHIHNNVGKKLRMIFLIKITTFKPTINREKKISSIKLESITSKNKSVIMGL